MQTKKITIYIILLGGILAVLWFILGYFLKYKNYKSKAHIIKQLYTLDINFEKLKQYEEIFFNIKDVSIPENKEAKYKIYDGAIMLSWYDRISNWLDTWKPTKKKKIIIIKKIIKNEKNRIDK